jgi:putative autoinducer-2 (AI-2) aldolase
MPEVDTREGKNFHERVPPSHQGFLFKSSGSCHTRTNDRLERISRPETGTVVLPIDHGYFQGPATGLERVDLNIVPIAQYAYALMLTRGILRSTIATTHRGGIVMRASGGPSILELSQTPLEGVRCGRR